MIYEEHEVSRKISLFTNKLRMYLEGFPLWVLEHMAYKYKEAQF